MEHQTLDSEWNQAKATHMRIHFALMACKEAKYSWNMSAWYLGLVDFYAELSGSMTDPEVKNEWTKLQELRSVRDTENMDESVQDIFMDVELGLRKIMRERGLDLPRKRDPGKALLDDKGY